MPLWNSRIAPKLQFCP